MHDVSHTVEEKRLFVVWWLGNEREERKKGWLGDGGKS